MRGAAAQIRNATKRSLEPTMLQHELKIKKEKAELPEKKEAEQEDFLRNLKEVIKNIEKYNKEELQSLLTTCQIQLEKI